MARELSPLPLPPTVRSRYIDCSSSCGLNFHVLESGSNAASASSPRKSLVLLLHGFPELSFSWRHILPSLAQAGYHVVAPDQRGYGRTTGWDARPYGEVDLAEFKVTQLVSDTVCLVHALGYRRVHCLVGHDFGAWVAGYAALVRPDIFQSLVLMSHPFKGAPKIPFAVSDSSSSDSMSMPKGAAPDIHEALAELDPPRKHYQRYNSTPSAAVDWYCQGDEQRLETFLRGYIHLKSADWTWNSPKPLPTWTATVLQQLPHYYVMPLGDSMPSTIASSMIGEDASLTCRWLPDADLRVYVQEWQATGFQGALNWYRSNAHPSLNRDLNMFAGMKIKCPAMFVTGEKDWGKFQVPGVWDNLSEKFEDFRGRFDVRGGHWPQQEDSCGTVKKLLEFLEGL